MIDFLIACLIKLLYHLGVAGERLVRWDNDRHFRRYEREHGGLQ